VQMARFWHLSNLPTLPTNVGYQGKSGSDSDIVKQALLTPTATSAVPFECASLSRYDAMGSGEAMRRREFITLLGSLAAGWPLAAPAQQPKRRIGLLMPNAEDDPEGQARVRAFLDGLQQLGWTDGRNVRVDIRWTAGSPADTDKYAAELVAFTPDVILASGSANMAALQRITHRVPVVFANVIDPVGAGFVASLARPGGNTTGFSSFEYSLSGKWLELLKEIAPNLTRFAVLRDPSLAAGIGQFAAMQALAPPSLGAELSPIDSRNPSEIERAIAAFARERNGGLIVTGSQSSLTHRNLIIALALRYRLPNIYAFRYYPAGGGLASYGPDTIDVHKRTAEYVDRVLKGEKPADLPVQAPTKYELVINLKAASALGITVPRTVLDRADEVIE
jgi:putative tryptophan/tyrosine transport system substrate-binding protein